MIRRLAVALALLVPAHAFADAKADAKLHIDKASTAHAAGKLDVTLAELNIAYTLDPQAELLFAIAQVHVQLGHCPQAITFYERFLATHPDDEAVAVTTEAIETCKKAPPSVVEAKPTPEPPPPQPPPPPPAAPSPQAPPPAPAAVDRPPFYTDVIGDALVGAGVVCGIVGALEYASARSSLDDAEHASSYMASQALVDQAHSRRNLAIGFEVGGLALVGAGVVHYLVLHHPADRGVAIVPSKSGGLVTWSGHF